MNLDVESSVLISRRYFEQHRIPNKGSFKSASLKDQSCLEGDKNQGASVGGAKTLAGAVVTSRGETTTPLVTSQRAKELSCVYL